MNVAMYLPFFFSYFPIGRKLYLITFSLSEIIPKFAIIVDDFKLFVCVLLLWYFFKYFSTIRVVYMREFVYNPKYSRALR